MTPALVRSGWRRFWGWRRGCWGRCERCGPRHGWHRRSGWPPPPPPAARPGGVDRLGRWPGVRPTTMMILRSVARWPGRAAVTFFGVAGSVAVLVACFYIFDAMDLLMDEVFVQSNRQDMTLMLAAPVNDIAVIEALHLPGV